MEEMNENREQQEHEGYKPRPVWQIVLAWIGVAVVAAAFILYLYNIASGGLL